MPEDPTTNPPATDPNSSDPSGNAPDPPTGNGPDLTSEVEKWKSLARKHEKDSKDFRKELDTLKTQSLTEQEKAIAEAKALGASEAKSLFGSKLVASEIKVGLAGRIDGEDFDSLIKGLNVNSFLNDDGDVDTEAVAGFVKALLPPESDDDKKKKSNLNLGQGARGNTSLADDNALENAILRHAGVRRS